LGKNRIVGSGAQIYGGRSESEGAAGHGLQIRLIRNRVRRYYDKALTRRPKARRESTGDMIVGAWRVGVLD